MNDLARLFPSFLLVAPALAQATWENRTPIASPRQQHCMAYDAARQRIVLYGGIGSGCSYTCYDTWEWTGTSWVSRYVPGAPVPLGVIDAAFAFDDTRQRAVLFGGNGRDETWEWDGSVWRQYPANLNRPPARSLAALAFDAVRAKVVLFGGGTGTTQLLADTWEFDGSLWTQRTPATSPSARFGHAMAFDRSRGRVVLFGGEEAAITRGDTWEWDGNAWSQRFPAVSPPARTNHALAFDGARGVTVLFGGFDAAHRAPLSDTWEWNGTAWLQRAPATSPAASGQHALAYHAARGRTVLFGPYGLWEWDGTNWTPGPPAGSPPVGLFGDGMVHDSRRGRTLFVPGGPFGTTPNLQAWEWDGTAWRDRTVAPAPVARSRFALAFDQARGFAVLFGGEYDAAMSFADTWEWDGTAWSQRIAFGAPPARGAHAMAFDTARARTVLFGGEPSFRSATSLADTWEWDGTAWAQGAPAVRPPARAGHAMAFDGLRGRTVVFGGLAGNATYLGDTWEWDGVTWTPANPAVSPPARAWHTLAFDPRRGRTLLFGGVNGQFTEFRDLWEWDGTSWMQRTPASSPCPRQGHVAAFDAGRGRMVVFAGASTSAPAPCFSLYGKPETWEYFVPYDTVGPGHPGGGLPPTCTSPPILGGVFTLSFQSAYGFAYLFLGGAPCLTPPVAVGPPALCAPGWWYGAARLVLPLTGNPATVAMPLPLDPALAGQAFCLQGFAFDAAVCFRATDAMLATLQPPR